jgi:gluconate:H+ symporter, GntP family
MLKLHPLLSLTLGALVVGAGENLNGLSLGELADSVSSSFGPIAGITFIVAAGGGFKQVLVDSGIAGRRALRVWR